MSPPAAHASSHEIASYQRLNGRGPLREGGHIGERHFRGFSACFTFTLSSHTGVGCIVSSGPCLRGLPLSDAWNVDIYCFGN